MNQAAALNQRFDGFPGPSGAALSRGAFLDGLSELVRTPSAPGAATLLCIGIDRYHVLRESMGEQAAQLALRTVERRLLSVGASGDLVVHLGEDTFAFLCWRQGREEAAALAQRLSQMLAEPFEVAGRRLGTTVSIGVAVSDRRSRPEALLSDASMALHQARQVGRATTVVFDDRLRTRAADAFEIEAALHGAIERGELRLVFQPTVDMHGSGAVNGVEALLRWDHPTLGEVSPERFIPVAEETGMIAGIGQWVLQEACTTVARWNSGRAAGEELTVAVNISPQELEDPAFGASLQGVLARTRLPAGLLRVEITERALLNDGESTMRQLAEIRRLGIRIAIDDFGTGYSSLAYLSRFPVDVVKIDKSFVQSLDDGRNAAVVSAVVAMAHELGLVTVGEGIETPRQLRHLVDLGCDEGQGYLIARPGSAAELSDLGAVSRQLHQALGQRRVTAPPPVRRHAHGAAPAGPDSLTVLVVDDDATHLDLAGYLLAAGGVHVATAATAEELQVRLDEIRPDIVLMDLRMPDATGEELAALVHQRHGDDLPVVAVTSYPEWVAEGLMRDDLFVGSIPKPVDPLTFVASVRSHLAGQP